MTRISLTLIATVSLLAVSFAVEAQTPTPKKASLPKSNQVYVKIIWHADPAPRGKNRPVVESWIAELLKKRGQTKFTAATAWVPLGDKVEVSTSVWNATLDGEICGCPVRGGIVERADGRIKIHFDGWRPAYTRVTVSLPDEPGSREIAAVEQFKTEQGLPYVVVLIGAPPEKTAARTDPKK